MRAKSVYAIVTVAALLVLLGVLAQADFKGPHCGVDFDRVDVGGGSVDAYVLHSLYRNDNAEFASDEINTIDIEVDVPIPNKLPGFDTLASALDQSFTVKFNHGFGAVFATCEVHASRVLGLNGKLSYAMQITDDNGKVNFRGGVCDIEPWIPGLQAGVPNMQLGDIVVTYAEVDDELVFVSSGRVKAY